MDPAVLLARKQGALLGLAVGDALGATTEHRRLDAPPFPALLEGVHTEMVGGGRFRLQPGQVTDETQLACCLAEVLRPRPPELEEDERLPPLDDEASSEGYHAERALKAYLAWRPKGFDIEEQTRTVLDRIKAGAAWEHAAREHWVLHAKQPAGDGPLTRTVPIAVHLATSAEARRAAIFEDVALTHFDPRCQLACAALTASLCAALLARAPVTPASLVAAARTELSIAGAALGRRIPTFVLAVQEAVAALREDLTLAESDDPQLHGPELHLHEQRGFIRVPFRLAYWEILHAPSFEAALVDVVNRGGGADTNGAITGALFGAWRGVDQIPERWRTAVLEALDDGRGHPFWKNYHPRHLLALADPPKEAG